MDHPFRSAPASLQGPYTVAILGLVSAACALHLLRVYWRLKHIPGPFWAKFTNAQRVLWVRSRRAHEIHHAVHEKYGEIAQFGPNMVSLANPAWIPTVYPIRPGFPKSNFYRTLMPYTRKGGSLPAVFNTRDEELHKRLKSPIAPLFSLSNTLPLEPFVNQTIQAMTEQIDKKFVASQAVFDLADWLQYFAFDVMGTLTFSKRYGFLEQGRDVDNMLSTIWTYMETAAPMTQIPWLDNVMYKNSVTAMFRKTTGFTILGIVAKYIAERVEARKAVKSEGNNGLSDRDLLSQFMDLTANNASLPPWCVTAWTFSNVIAGSDSTAVVMRTVWYNLLAHPSTLDRLRQELLEAERISGLSTPYPSWKEVEGLPYLDACILEAVRLHPPFCLPFERVVPEGGMMIGETFFPGGTVVGMSPYVANRHKPTFGDDANDWNPDRWMVPKELKQRREMGLLTFGAGRRVCLGRHIAILELKKIVPALLLRYQFELIDKHRYQVQNSWFFKQKGIDVRPMCHLNPSRASMLADHLGRTCSLFLNPPLFWQPEMKGLNGLTVPIYCFLVSRGNRHVLFDLGVRRDWERYAPKTVDLIQRTTKCHVEMNVADILNNHAEASNGAVRPGDVEAIIWSHHHFDHIGDPSTFPPTTDLVVGPGVKQLCWPGFPSNPDAFVLDADITGRTLREVDFSSNPLQVGNFAAFDYFGDGSFYLLDSPGHSIGHLTALARVTTAGDGCSEHDSFVFMGADACHHPGVLRPTEYLPLPANLSPSPFEPNNNPTEPFFTVSHALFPDHKAAMETVRNITELDAADNIFVILAHDESIQGHIDLFPSSINDWKAKGTRSKTRWLFCKDFAEALGPH
ncbi:MpaD/MpaE fusion protein [Xylariomycetidae sp. FL0641]|nr:MpaD/MpaE fusion protein [Xylariomycetidae sp. FL0641]